MKNFGCMAAALFLFSSYLAADDETVLTADSPERLRTLVEGYERERARVLDPLERKFDEALSSWFLSTVSPRSSLPTKNRAPSPR